jgi:hypothetical protein
MNHTSRVWRDRPRKCLPDEERLRHRRRQKSDKTQRNECKPETIRQYAVRFYQGLLVTL